MEMVNVPTTGESIADYVRRLRTGLGLTQKELAKRANIHIHSLGKIERGLTTRLNQKTLRGLAYALSIPSEYLESVSKGVPVSASDTLKFCPICWTPGTPPDEMWLSPKAKFCMFCGTALCDRCSNCNQPIMSGAFRFCPYCGHPYKTTFNK